MHPALTILLEYRYAALFAYVLASQCGIPVPSTPVLIVAGALVADGRFGLLPALATILLACLVADSGWFALGKARGSAVLRTLCRISMEPAACVRGARHAISRYGAKFLLVAKFVPGVGLMASPSAGHAGMRYRRFACFAAAGAAGWSGAYLMLGAILGRELERWEGRASMTAGIGVALVAASAIGITAARLFRVHRARRLLARRAVSAFELNRRIQRGDDVRIVDLRGRGDVSEDRLSIPGAVQLTMGELLTQLATLPISRDIVLLCDCPDDVASVEGAAKLQRMGFGKAVPLEGGLRGWKMAGLPLVPV